jgi:hypothetical protein
MAALTDLAYFIFYSGKELSKRQMLLRYFVHFTAIMGIALSIAVRMGWISRAEPVRAAVFAGLVAAVYITVFIVTMYQSKKLAEKLNRKLRERYK